MAQRDAEISLDRIADEAGELHGRGIVQAQFVPQFGALGIGGVLAQHDGHGVAHVLKQHEGQQGNGDHHRGGLQ